MRRLIIILLVVCLISALAAISIRPIIVILAKKQLENIFIKGQVSIGRCVFRPATGLSLFDIAIKNQGVYDIKVKEAAIQFKLFSILKTSSLTISLKSPVVYVNAPKKSIRDFSGYLKIGRGAPIFKSVEVSDLVLDLNMLNMTTRANLGLRLNLPAQSLDYLNLKINTFSIFGLQLENVLLEFGPDSEQGQFSLLSLKYDKFSAADIKGNIKLQDMTFSAYGVSAKVLNGIVQLDLKIDKGLCYSLDMKCADFDIEKFIQDFNLREKFDMTGKLNGTLKVKGQANRIEMLEGDFSTLLPGGKLVITDTKFLENMAKTTRQPTSLLVESFKNYWYNIGVMNLGLEKGNIFLKINLQGDTGKRDFNLILHDFKLWEEGR